MHDQIFLKDYKKTIEIGAFAEERQILQDISLSIYVDLRDQSPSDDEAVDDILSYDVLVDAIENNLSQRRYNLLEALAEDIANHILAEPTALSVIVEIQKLSRIDGALGIQIKRSGHGKKSHTAQTVYNLAIVAFDEITKIEMPTSPTVFLPMIAFEPTRNTIDQHLITLKLDAKSWEIARHLDLPVIDTQTETEALIARGSNFVRAYGKQIFAASPPIETFDQAKLIDWATGIIRPSKTTILE